LRGLRSATTPSTATEELIERNLRWAAMAFGEDVEGVGIIDRDFVSLRTSATILFDESDRPQRPPQGHRRPNASCARSILPLPSKASSPISARATPSRFLDGVDLLLDGTD